MDTVHYPKLRIEVPEKGNAYLTRVTIDGEQWPVTRVSFDTGEDISGFVKVRLEFYAGIELESETPLALTSIERTA